MRRFPLLLRIGLAILPFLACDAGTPAPDGSAYPVNVLVTNTSHQPVVGVPVNVDGQTLTTGNDGSTPQVTVRHGERRIAVSAEGYTPYSNTFRITRGQQIAIELRGPSQVTGQVVNSQNGQGIDGATVTFSRNGRIELTETTGGTGHFSFTDAPDGTFLLEILKSGFVYFRRENVQITGGSFVLDPVALAATPPAGALRIVLTWGDAPADLDAHLTGPGSSGGGRFHVYYFARTADVATLDHDDTSSNGPETITLTTPRDGMYRFSVHNFSDQSTAGAAGMASSPTRVEVYDSNGRIKSYTSPSGGSGNTWRVFELAVSGGTRTFSDNGGASLGYVQATGSGDVGTFLTGRGGPPAPAAKPPSL